MKGLKRSVLAIFVILILSAPLAVNIGNATKAVIVSDVESLYHYVPMENNFIRGGTVNVYIEMLDVNHKGFTSVDFFFVIEDPLGHVVSMDKMGVNRRNYDRHVYVVYTKTIPSWWKYGKYNLDIYAYNRLDKAQINELSREVEVTVTRKTLFDDEDAFEDMGDLFGTACGGDRDDLEDLNVIKPISESMCEIKQIRFYVCKEEEVKEEGTSTSPDGVIIKGTKFTVTDVALDKFTVKPNETVSISVTVKNEGVKGTEKIALIINGEKEAEASVTLESMQSETLYFTVTKSLYGTYKVSIPGTNIVKLFFVREIENNGETLDSSLVTTGTTHNNNVCMEVKSDQMDSHKNHSEKELLVVSNKKEGSKLHVVSVSSVFDLIYHQISRLNVVF